MSATQRQPRQGLRPALEDLIEASRLFLTHARCRGKSLPTRDLILYIASYVIPQIFVGKVLYEYEYHVVDEHDPR